MDTAEKSGGTFQWIASYSGLSVDLVNFLICQISALFLASLFRSILHPSKVSPAIRHTFGLSVGLIFGYLCFGAQAIHIAGLPTICYIVLRTQSPYFVQRTIMVVAMLYLLTLHLHRQFYDWSSYSLDITGPLMIITQKVTSLAFSLHDGFVKEQDKLTKAQKHHAIYKMPSPLEFFAYLLHFQCILAGPLVFYKDYIDYIEGSNFLKSPQTTIDKSEIKEVIVEPSPIKTVVRKTISCLLCAFIYMKFGTDYPITRISDDEFINHTGFMYKIWFAIMATTLIRFKYYFAWLLADAICNNSGLGFSGYDKDGNPKWDLITNIYVLSFEFSTNIRDAINSWNCGTNRWLRMIVYERVPKKYGTILTFTLSAVWHGFYPGYYLTFATGAVFVTSARIARRLFRYRFQSTQYTRMFYDILTCLITRVAMGYATFPFVFLHFTGSIRLYLKLFLCLHIIGFFTIFVLPKFIRGEKKKVIQEPEANGIEGKESAKVESPPNSPVKSLSDKKNGLKEEKPLISVGDDAEKSTHEDNIVTPSKEHIDVRTPTKPKVPQEDPMRLQKDDCEMDKLSNIVREKIEIETKNIEEFLDNTVTETISNIAEFKNDLMRKNDTEGEYMAIRKRTTNQKAESVDAFIKMEIESLNAAVQQTNVIPVVLGNGHAK
ncbi:MBOAT1 family protein [Megaselia abdita]